MNIKDFKSPTGNSTVRCPALINDTRLVVMQMSSVDSSVGDNLDMMTLCTGSLETEILPLLTSNVMATEVCTMFYIEKIGQQIVYRNRNCSLVSTKVYAKCKFCEDLLEHLSLLYQDEDRKVTYKVKEELS